MDEFVEEFKTVDWKENILYLWLDATFPRFGKEQGMQYGTSYSSRINQQGERKY